MKSEAKKFREENAWSRSELARKAGIAERTLKNMEEGNVTQKTSRLKVAKSLEREYKEIFPNDID